MLEATTKSPVKRRILAAIATEIGQGEVTFPTTAQMALRIRHTLYDPDCAVGTAARLIQAEPLLAARIVGLANSALYRSQGRVITDVGSAVARLGFAVVRSLATALVIRQMAGAPADRAHRSLAAELWAHSTHVAALAHVLARRVTRQDPETAMFAGLLHEAGSFYLISRAGEFPGLLDGEFSGRWLDDSFDEDGATGNNDNAPARSLRTRIGRAILDALTVPAPVVEGIEAMWRGNLTLPPVSLGDTLVLAERLVPMRSPFEERWRGDAPCQDAPVDRAVGEKALADMLKEASAEVSALSAILRG